MSLAGFLRKPSRMTSLADDQTGTLGGFLGLPATTPLGKAQLRQRALRFAAVAALLSACASSPKPRAEQPQRVPDSAPDKIAAQRAAAGLHLEEEDERWGIDAARERKQRAEQQTPKPPPAPATSGPAEPAPKP
jgi:hypothetical protein